MSSLSLSGSSLSPPPHHCSPAVLLNIGICVSAAWLVDQLGRRGGGHSNAACSMSIRPQLSFKAPGCQSASLITPQWDQREKKKKKNLSGSCKCARVWFLPSVVWFACTNRAVMMIPERTLAPGWSRKIKSSHADKIDSKRRSLR